VFSTNGQFSLTMRLIVTYKVIANINFQRALTQLQKKEKKTLVHSSATPFFCHPEIAASGIYSLFIARNEYIGTVKWFPRIVAEHYNYSMGFSRWQITLDTFTKQYYDLTKRTETASHASFLSDPRVGDFGLLGATLSTTLSIFGSLKFSASSEPRSSYTRKFQCLK